jgi:glycosyltransferase involved in cell wall biosynthesis
VNIWMVNHYANHPGAPGDARHFSHARELIARGHQVRIVSCSFLHLNGQHVAEAAGRDWTEVVYQGVPFTWIHARSYGGSLQRIRNMMEFSWRVGRRKWAKNLDRPDLVLGSSPHPFAALAAQRLAAHYGVPFVLEIRDVWPYVLTEVGGHSKSHPFVRLVDATMRFLYKRASRIIMFSRNSAHLLTDSGADERKILWIPHGVDMGMSPVPRPAPEDGVFTVTYIGAHNQWNSLDAVLDAAKILQESDGPRVLFRFVGDGASKPGLILRTQQEGIRNVQFDAPVAKTQVPEILHNADAFLINNRKDEVSKNWMSFNKLYEYLAAGRPVVFGSCSNNNPVQESGAGISVEADDPAAMAGAILFLAGRSAEQLADYGRRGRRHIEENYNIPLLVDRLEAMASEVTGKPSGVLSLQ